MDGMKAKGTYGRDGLKTARRKNSSSCAALILGIKEVLVRDPCAVPWDAVSRHAGRSTSTDRKGVGNGGLGLGGGENLEGFRDLRDAWELGVDRVLCEGPKRGL